MAKKAIILLTLLLALLIPTTISAITYSPPVIDLTWTKGVSVPISINVSLFNPKTTSEQVDIIIEGDISSFITITPTSFTIQNESYKDIKISLNIPSTTENKLYSGKIRYGSANNDYIPVYILVNGQETIATCAVDIFPTTLSNIKVKQGEGKSKSILVTVPSCYDDYVDFRAVSLQSDEQPIELGEISLGKLQPGSSVVIPISIDAVGVATGTYYETLQFNLANSQGIKIDVPSVSVSVIVTAGINPITNQTFSTMPSCSLSATDMIINSTYELICTSIDPNLQISPVYNEYIEGRRVDETSTQYTYKFSPSKIGDTTFRALFLYKSSPIGDGFSKDIRITRSALSGGSVYLDFKFFPSIKDLKDGDELNILIVDNETNSVVSNAKLYVNGKESSNNNFTVNIGEEYSLIASAPSYLDNNITVTLNPSEIEIILDPESPKVGDEVEISTVPKDATIYINGEKLKGSWNPTAVGDYTINASIAGHNSTILTINVGSGVEILSSPSVKDDDEDGYPELEKGKEYVVKFNKNVSAEVKYRKSEEDSWSGYPSESSQELIFTPNEEGYYSIWVEGINVKQYEVVSALKWWIIGGAILAMIIVAFVVIGYAGRSKMPSSSHDRLNMEFQMPQQSQ